MVIGIEFGAVLARTLRHQRGQGARLPQDAHADRTAAAAGEFTSWNFVGTQYHFNKTAHDGGRKTVLGRTGNLTGEAVIG